MSAEQVLKRLESRIITMSKNMFDYFTNLENQMSVLKDQIDALTAIVNNAVTVEQSAVELLNGLGKQLSDVAETLAEQGADVTALTDLRAHLSDETAALAAAITANTPAAPVGAPASAETPAPVETVATTETTPPAA
jgi:regulator of replication initiation timing